MILYDIDSDEIIHILNFDYKIDVNLSGGPLNATRHEMRNISFDVGEAACDYIRDWYLETLKQTNGKLRYAAEYKRDLYVTDLKDHNVKLINCFIKSVEDKDSFLTVEVYCDHYIHGDKETFPELRSLYRNAVLSVLGI
jgi:hypothetical protein